MYYVFFVFIFIGEISFGKSSLINFIMGEEIFFNYVFSIIFIICEVKFGKECKIVVYFMDKDLEMCLLIKEIYLKENLDMVLEKDSYF